MTFLCLVSMQENEKFPKMSKHCCNCVTVLTRACFCSKQEEEQSSERRVPKCIKRQEATPAWVSDGQTH